mgnify:FL=1
MNDENAIDINTARRVRNMEKAIVIFESQLAAIKSSLKLLAEHRDFRFFSIICHELAAENKVIATELLKMRVRLDNAKAQLTKEVEDENHN